MKIRELLRAHWTIYAACDSRGDCTLLGWLSNMDKSLTGYSDGMVQLLQRVAQNPRGPAALGHETSHQIRGDIYQLRHGPLRVLYFNGERRSIICSHGFKKKTGKTPRRQIKKAERALNEYREAKRQGHIELLGDDDGD